MPQPDFIPVSELAKLSGYNVKSIYNQHSSGKGAFATILTKFGGKVGAWRKDYEKFVESQLKLRDAA